MAYIRLTEDDNVPFYYDVDMAVGPNAPNRQDDVMLVQYFLREVYRHARTLQISRPAGRDMTVDGRFGRTTALWITDFQREIRSQGFPVRVDGRVDPSRGFTSNGNGGYGPILSSISQTIYIILFLNAKFREVHPSAFANIALEQDCPPELGNAVGLVMLGQTA